MTENTTNTTSTMTPATMFEQMIEMMERAVESRIHAGLERKIQNTVVDYLREEDLDKEFIAEKMDRKIDAALERHAVDADNVDGLDRYVESAVENGLADVEISADHVEGLEDEIDKIMEKQFASFEVDCDAVDGLEAMIDEKIEDAWKGEYVQERINLAIADAFGPDKVQAAVEAALNTPKVQLLLANKLQEALVATVTKFVGAALTQKVA